MANWSLRHPTEIKNGLGFKVKAEHLIDNFELLKSDIDDRISKVATSSQSIISPITVSGAITASAGLLADTISEVTTNNGVAIEGVKLKDSGISIPTSELTLASGTATLTGSHHTLRSETASAADTATSFTADRDGQIVILQAGAADEPITIEHGTGNISLASGVDYVLSDLTDSIMLRWNDTDSKWYQIAQGKVTVGLPEKGVIGALPYYNDAASIKIPASFKIRDTTNTVDITPASELTVSLASSGANGRDTGTEAADTDYYVYLIGDSSGTNATAGLFSTTNESDTGTITLPSGYDQKAQLPFCVRNNGSSNIIPFFISSMQAGEAKVTYEVSHIPNGTAPVLGDTGLIAQNGSLQTSWGASGVLDASDFVPPIADKVVITVQPYTGGYHRIFVRANGQTHDGYAVQGATNPGAAGEQIELNLNSAKEVQYYSSLAGNTLRIGVVSYTARI